MPNRGRDRRTSLQHNQVKDIKARTQTLLAERQYADTLAVDRDLLNDLLECAALLDRLLTSQDRRAPKEL